MGDTCLPGLQGFPVQVTGWTSFTDRASITKPNDITLQFSPSEVPLNYNKQNGMFGFYHENTFFMEGTQFALRAVRMAEYKQTGLSDFSDEPYAELSFYGTPTNSEGTVKPNLAVFIIPIFVRNAESPEGERLLEATQNKPVKLKSLIPQGDSVNVLTYTTCVENDQRTTTKIAVAYWTRGMAITNEMIKKLDQQAPVGTYERWGIPNVLGYKLLTSFEPVVVNSTEKKEKRVYETRQNYFLRPYQTVVPVGATTNEFKNGFRLISGFKQAPEKIVDTSAYKCIPIDRSRDIRDGKLLVDVKTGRRLDDELKVAEAGERLDAPEGDPNKLVNTVVIIVGVILGIFLLACVVYGIFYLFGTRKTLELPPVTPQVAKTAAALGPQAGS
jgi:hypothetical protein